MRDALLDACQASRLDQAVRLELHRERRDVLQNPDERRQVQNRDGPERHPVRRVHPDRCA